MKLVSRLILFLVFLLLQSIQTDFAYLFAEENSQSIDNDYSAENILGFIRYLVPKNEYYRAFVELKRLESFYPGYVKKDNIFTTELFLLFKGRRFPEILTKEFQEINPDTKAIYLIFKTDSFIEKSEFINAKTVVDSTGFAGYNKDINLYLYKRMILSYLLLNMIDETKKLIDNNTVYFDTATNEIQFSELAEYSSDYHNSFKKPYNAMALGLIPGMGYVYAGQKATGIIAFFLVSILSTLTYYSFRTDNKPIGIFIGTAATFFYGGSIIGGYLSARKYNDSAMIDMKDSLCKKLRLDEDRERIFNEYGVGSAGK